MSDIVIFEGFGQVMAEVAWALAPLTLFFLVYQFFFIKLPRRKVLEVVVGMVLVFLGISFFLQGVHVGFMPAGTMMGSIMGALSFNWILVPVGFVLGFVVVFAEPAVQILNQQVEKVTGGSISSRVMLYTLSLGVGFSVALAMLRTLLGFSLWYILIPGYALVLLLIRYSSKTFTGLAFDAGGVATGPMTVTFILALAVGVATEIEGRDPLVEGFGMVALVALAPILSVMILGFLYNRKEKTNG
jgi:hypothetical protein